MDSVNSLFETYLKSGLYLRGWSPKTVVIYKRAFTSFQHSSPEAFTKAALEAWIISRREAGMSPCGINIYIRAMNSFAAWQKEEGHCSEQVVLKQLKAPQKAVTVFSDQDIRLLLAFKPGTFTEFRTWTLMQLLLDTGLRINEAITLTTAHLDFANLLLEVLGKGNKTRRVPFSQELRKPLYQFALKRDARESGRSPWVFCAHSGSRLMYRNVYRDLIGLCMKVGITKRVHPHLTRHTFACHFMKNGGSIYTLSRILGHTSVSTTQIYIRGLGVEDFKEEHARLSPLVRR